jgi:hypothetical protein
MEQNFWFFRTLGMVFGYPQGFLQNELFEISGRKGERLLSLSQTVSQNLILKTP